MLLLTRVIKLSSGHVNILSTVTFLLVLIFFILLMNIKIHSLAEQVQKLQQVVPQQITVVHQYTIANDTQEEVLAAAIPGESVTTLDLPDVSGEFKGYMDYHTITDKSSYQYMLRKIAVTDTQGFRKINGKYMIAVGKFYATEVGKELRVTIDNTVIDCIVGDIKAHTDDKQQHQIGSNNIIEFIVDETKLDESAKFAGDVSKLGLAGTIVKIEEVVRSDT